MNRTDTHKALFVESGKQPYYITKLPRGVYSIDGENTTINEQQEVYIKDLESVFRLSHSQVITKYIDANSEITPDEYDKYKLLLQSKGIYNDDNYDWDFPELDDEYDYKKFCRRWTPVRVEVINRETQLLFTTVKTELDTDNPFITPIYFATGELTSMYRYTRHSACMTKFRELCIQLGLRHSEDKGKDTFNIPTHSALQYAKVCGHYVFDGLWSDRNLNTSTGDYGALKSSYDKDMQTIEDRIRARVNLESAQLNVNLNKSLELSKNLIAKIAQIDSKNKTYQEYTQALNMSRNLLVVLTKEIANQTQEQK